MYLYRKINQYYVFQSSLDGDDFKKFVKDFKKILLGKSLAVVSFDYDSLKPLVAEYRRGWIYDAAEVSYFGELTRNELEHPIYANNGDEWYLFDCPSKFTPEDVFVSYSGFRLIDLTSSDLMKSVQDRFWAQTIRNDPASFILLW
ncbi:MAG: hypothetical protein AAF741_05755 [Bacteroidota bacterium]